MGCGHQEQFLNCADVAIIAEDEGNNADLNRIVQVQENQQPKAPLFSTLVQVYNKDGTTKVNYYDSIYEKGKVDKTRKSWSENNIDSDQVISILTTPKKLRVLAKLAAILRNVVITCRSIGVWKTVSGMDIWCRRNCGPKVFKPSPGCATYCKC